MEKIIARRGDQNFYFQRCAKECLVKWLNLTLEEGKDNAHIVQTKEEQGTTNLSLQYQNNIYPVQVWEENGYVYAVMKKT
jgi:hypothetical protein